MSFRPDLYLVARITKALVENGPLQKTKLSLLADMAYDRMIVYVNWMTEHNLILENDGHIDLTENGVRTYEELVSWIVKYVGRVRFPRER